MTANIHVLETGQGWEVWRVGDSMPLGTYVSEIEADEMAAAAAAADGSEVHVDDRHIEVDESAVTPLGEEQPSP